MTPAPPFVPVEYALRSEYPTPCHTLVDQSDGVVPALCRAPTFPLDCCDGGVCPFDDSFRPRTVPLRELCDWRRRGDVGDVTAAAVVVAAGIGLGVGMAAAAGTGAAAVWDVSEGGGDGNAGGGGGIEKIRSGGLLKFLPVVLVLVAMAVMSLGSVSFASCGGCCCCRICVLGCGCDCTGGCGCWWFGLLSEFRQDGALELELLFELELLDKVG